MGYAKKMPYDLETKMTAIPDHGYCAKLDKLKKLKKVRWVKKLRCCTNAINLE